MTRAVSCHTAYLELGFDVVLGQIDKEVVRKAHFGGFEDEDEDDRNEEV